jgi:hypothetical protein
MATVVSEPEAAVKVDAMAPGDACIKLWVYHVEEPAWRAVNPVPLVRPDDETDMPAP